jgi:hypothetical protein
MDVFSAPLINEILKLCQHHYVLHIQTNRPKTISFPLMNQVDISGFPPIPLAQITISILPFFL